MSNTNTTANLHSYYITLRDPCKLSWLFRGKDLYHLHTMQETTNSVKSHIQRGNIKGTQSLTEAVASLVEWH